MPAEIPRHLLNSDDSDEEEDNDSDYGSPKKGRGRGKTTGRVRKAKDAPAAEAPAARPRRGRRAAATAARDSSPHNIVEEADNSQSTQETQETAETTENEATEPSEPVNATINESAEHIAYKQEPIQTTSEPVPVIQIDDDDKVSEVTIEQDLRSNNDQAPVNEEDGGKESDVETGRESVDKVVVTHEVEESAEPETIVLNDEESKEAPESSIQSESRSNSTDKEVYRQRARSSSGEVIEDSSDKMEVNISDKEMFRSKMDVDPPAHVQEEEKAPEPKQKVIEVVPAKEMPVAVEEKAPAPTQRKRKWTARKNDDAPVIAITTDSLKNIISEEMKPVPLSDVKLSASPEPEPEEKRIRTKATADDKDARKKLLMERLRKQEEEEERRNEQLVKAIDKSQAPSNGTSSNGSALLKDRKVSIIIDAPPSPPKHDCSNILYITNLVRPFTVLQLKGLLARTGKIVDNGFWIDKIKSKCYVKYETEE